MSSSNCPTRLVSKLIAEDQDLRDIVEEFVSALPGRVTELNDAYRKQDWEALSTLAHRLKGAGGSYGYDEISKLGATMEDAFRARQASDFASWLSELEQLVKAAQAGLNP